MVATTATQGVTEWAADVLRVLVSANCRDLPAQGSRQDARDDGRFRPVGATTTHHEIDLVGLVKDQSFSDTDK